ncbi:methyltransferase domain-containing protein [Periweissella cryptocerci]|uniref:Methyltransferase domain-containing protein n=1 Tax=Periweissella cryptocerci TaxID=2506420 RepID=A0A4P6YU82_9LACO|nr:methyltransferase [Periweissella cryptocerci]QBO36237.1 methyltransferase domain-containing protein [Periweissella cryptocerci]
MNIKGYYDNVTTYPWGKIFYDILWQELEHFSLTDKHILDFGSGFGKTSNHYAEHNDVVAYEPNTDELAMRFSDNEYTQLSGNLNAFQNSLSRLYASFDMIFIHNVLEYADNREAIITSLSKYQGSGGLVSVVKHNQAGRVMAMAVLQDDPAQALSELNGGIGSSVNHGDIHTYENEELIAWMTTAGYELVNITAIRNFYALSQNSARKYDTDWYDNMMQLELAVSHREEYIKMAFFNHLIFRKL